MKKIVIQGLWTALLAAMLLSGCGKKESEKSEPYVLKPISNNASEKEEEETVSEEVPKESIIDFRTYVVGQEVISGDYGNGFTYRLVVTYLNDPIEKKEVQGLDLIIDGGGALTGKSADTKIPWAAYRDYILKYTLSDEITEIGAGILNDCPHVSIVTLPGTLEKLDPLAFDGCTGMRVITIPEDNMNFHTDLYGILYNKDETQLLLYPPCNGEETYKAPEGLEFNPAVFENCRNLKTIVYKNTVCTPEMRDGLTNVENVICWQIDDRARMIISGKGTISGAYVPYKEYGMELGVMIFEEGITGISGFRYLFSEETNIDEIHFPASLKYIEEDSFLNYDIGFLPDPHAVYIEDITAWCDMECGEDQAALYNISELYVAGEKVDELIIPEGVKEIKANTFVGLHIENLILPDSLESIGKRAFVQLHLGSRTLTFPKNLKSLGELAFFSNTIDDLYINSSLEEVGSNAFENKAADNVHISDLLGWCEKGLGKDIRALQYYLGDELIEDLVIPDGVTAIKQGAFNRHTFNTITIPKSVLAIDLDAFSAREAIYYEGSEAEWNEITLMNKSDDKIVFLNH